MPERFEAIRRRILAFRDERDWHQFHSPKDLAEAIAIEAAELLELFLWKDGEHSRTAVSEATDRVSEEVADILIFLVYLCEEAGISLLDAVEHKLRVNDSKYPAERSRGRSDKYKEP